MFKQIDRKAIKAKAHLRVRKRVQGTSERPRLNVFRSLNHIYAQIIDDTQGHTIVAASTVDPELNKSLEVKSNVEAAQAVGKAVAEKALAKGIKQVVFDRGGNIYHGRVKALAEAAREAGLDF